METPGTSFAAATAPIVSEIGQAKNLIWLSLTRILLGLIFLWAFFDKLFGLGFATKSGQAWVNGVSPTTGFLTHATTGPLAGMFSGLAGSAIVDWLYMLGLLLVGASLLFGIGLRVAGRAGALMMILFYLSLLWPVNNPLIDEHLVYLAILLAIGARPHMFGGWSLHGWWTNHSLARRHTWMI